MKYECSIKRDSNFIQNVMFLFDEKKQPISSIAYIMNSSVDEINEIICSQLSNSIMELS